ncbi:hypothetical protein ACWDZ8_15885, partial [Streptomyces sp. NPDC003233]
LFCTGHTQLANGNLLIAGGTKRYEKLKGDVTQPPEPDPPGPADPQASEPAGQDTSEPAGREIREGVEPGIPEPVVARPVPLQEAPLGRLVTN